jgi:hypothetical protein
MSETSLIAARNRVLDAFALAEHAIVDLLDRASEKPPMSCASLGQKIEALKAVKPSPTFSKVRHSSLQAEIIKFEIATQVRNDIVHSILRIIDLEEPVALYCNARQKDKDYPKSRIMTVKDHDRLVADAIRLTKIINPPSPPPPSPGAAAGP